MLTIRIDFRLFEVRLGVNQNHHNHRGQDLKPSNGIESDNYAS